MTAGGFGITAFLFLISFPRVRRALSYYRKGIS